MLNDIVRHSVNGKLFMINSLINDLNSTSFAVKTNCRDGNAWFLLFGFSNYGKTEWSGR